MLKLSMLHFAAIGKVSLRNIKKQLDTTRTDETET